MSESESSDDDEAYESDSGSEGTEEFDGTGAISNQEKEENSSDEASDDEASSFRKELGDIPLGELQKLKQTVSLKRFNEAVFGSVKPRKRKRNDNDGEDDSTTESTKRGRPSKRNDNDGEEDSTTESTKRGRPSQIKDSDDEGEKKIAVKKVKKSEPEEVSSKKKGKKPIPKRVNVQGQKRNVRDPRFDDLSGTLNETMFEKSYGFLSEMRQNEVKKIRKALRKEKRPSQKADLHKLLQRMEQEDARKQEAVERKKKEKQYKQNEADSVMKGKKAFFLKKSDKKKLELADKYKTLKETGKLDKYLAKKRKKNASKERKRMPTTGRHDT